MYRPCVSILVCFLALSLWPKALFAQTSAAAGARGAPAFQHCDGLVPSGNIRSVARLERWSIGRLEDKNERYVVVDRTPSAQTPCSTFIRDSRTTNSQSLHIYRSELCTGEFCPTLIATTSPTPVWGVFERPCTGGFTVRPFSIEAPSTAGWRAC